MTGNTFGALKGRLTKDYNERVRDYEESERNRKQEEIRKNQGRWERAIAKLKRIDNNFDEWYDSDEVPEYILWTGEEFEKVLKIIKKRTKFLKTEKL